SLPGTDRRRILTRVRALAAAALLVALAALAGAGPGAAASTLAASTLSASTPCSGTPVKVFDNSNTGGVLNGGKPPTFDTKGKSSCRTSIVTYRWNNGRGATPGTVGVTNATMSASATARGSAGQGGAPNVNWTGAFTNPKAVTLNGTYTCTDSDPKTWSQN